MNRDLLLTGAFLHDIGKIHELAYQRSISYTTKGQLLGHMIIELEMLHEKLSHIPGFPDELKILIEHLIISHHGQYEFGSPKLPMFPEALMLHYLDDLDSKMESMRAQFERESELETAWTSYNPSLARPLLNTHKFLEKGGRVAASSESRRPRIRLSAPEEAAAAKPNPEADAIVGKTRTSVASRCAAAEIRLSQNHPGGRQRQLAAASSASYSSAMLDFSRFEYLSFDCYGTLIDWESGILGYLRPLLHSKGCNVSDGRFSTSTPNLNRASSRPRTAATARFWPRWCATSPANFASNSLRKKCMASPSPFGIGSHFLTPCLR